MANAKEIRTKIQSIQNTQKITRAMEMVAASKMRKAQDRMLTARPYAQRIRDVVTHVKTSNTEYRHPYVVERNNTKKIGLIIVSTDKGLCGGLNINLFKQATAFLKEWAQKGVDINMCLIGRKANLFFKHKGTFAGAKGIVDVAASTENLGDRPDVTDLLGAVKAMLDDYDNDNIQQLHVMYSHFVNTMSQKPQVQQLLPIPQTEDENLGHHWDYIYEPEAKELLETLFTRFIESQVYQSVVIL